MKKISKFLGLFLLGFVCILALASCGNKTTIVLNKGLQNETTITGTLYVRTGAWDENQGYEIPERTTYSYVLFVEDGNKVYEGSGIKDSYVLFRQKGTYKIFEGNIFFANKGYQMKGDYLIDPVTLNAEFKRVDKTL